MVVYHSLYSQFERDIVIYESLMLTAYNYGHNNDYTVVLIKFEHVIPKAINSNITF